jgi:DNA helicase-2/ATP-dependent DNA helicase PcrA
LVSDVDDLDEKVDAPTLLTLHAAKGLEFPVVFIVGLEEKLLPHSRSMDDPEQMEEERRLFYVGVTRAKERLYLFHTYRRTLHGERAIRDPSRFLHDIPAHLIKGPGRKRSVRQESLGLGAGRFLGRKQASAASLYPAGQPALRADERVEPAEPRFVTGDEVHHEVFGRGIVIESKPSGGDEEVAVAFPGLGLKRLLASVAPMEKVEEAG